MVYGARGSKAKRRPLTGPSEYSSKIAHSYVSKKITCVYEIISHRVRKKSVNAKALRKQMRTAQDLSSRWKFLACIQRYAFDGGIVVVWSLQVHGLQSIRQDVDSFLVVISSCHINGCFAWNKVLRTRKKVERKEKKTEQEIPTDFRQTFVKNSLYLQGGNGIFGADGKSACFLKMYSIKSCSKALKAQQPNTPLVQNLGSVSPWRCTCGWYAWSETSIPEAKEPNTRRNALLLERLVRFYDVYLSCSLCLELREL